MHYPLLMWVMKEDDQEDVILLDRPVIYVEADELAEELSDDAVGFDDITAEYQLAEVDDDYDEVILMEDADDDDEPTDVVLLDVERLDPAELDAA